MGDRNISTGVELEEEREMRTALHCPPLYPLPDEIQKMEHSETVCRYCGVSYLIFHEFHQLQTRLAQTEAELQGLRKVVEREKTQREALELGRQRWERELHSEVQTQAEAKEKAMREQLEEKNRETDRALKEQFERDKEKLREEVEERSQAISEERERRLRGDLQIQVERLREQREDLERTAEEKEKVPNDALQKAYKDSDELRKYLQQLEERLAIAASVREEAKGLLEKEKQQGKVLRGVCARQREALCSTLSTLRSSGRELSDVRGFLSLLTGTWQGYKSQILQHSTQVFSELREELKLSSVKLLKTTAEKQHLSQQLMHQTSQKEDLLSQQEDSEKLHTETLLRLKGKVDEKHQRWLSCQQRCDSMQAQLSTWQRREDQSKRKYLASEEEATALKRALEKVRQETVELRRDRQHLIDSHCKALTKTEEDCRQQMALKLADSLEEQRTQNALHLKEQREEFQREVELELMIDREKNQLLLLQYQRDSIQLQQKLESREQEMRDLQEDLQWERRRGEESRHISAVALLQETVRRECVEREELTAALSEAQEELHRLKPPATHPVRSRPPPQPPERNASPASHHDSLPGQAWKEAGAEGAMHGEQGGVWMSPGMGMG
ncbi:uncharacterized protein lekr1 [Genypterus blacodes]|uniref:uncharacterized protein lekr1 n=1 Tax=Genypterus blacodes TaxID=154954 RepID=UPI003F770C2D